MRLTIIARADLTGLGNQSRNWVRLLKPHKIIVIDSRPFNKNDQYFSWYSGHPRAYQVNGFISTGEINSILQDTDVLLTFESTYNYGLLATASMRGIKTILQNNWEFTDYLRQPSLPLPDLLVNHSTWHLNDQVKRWPDITDYCPSPLFIEDYESVYTDNMNRTGKKRFLHIAGRTTHMDRNGTQDLLEAVKLIPKDIDFELVIKSQSVEVGAFDDPRVSVDRSSPVDEKALYRDFDLVIMPRRYGGACLPMNEALAAGLPVIMPDIDPNNKILPEGWLVPAEKKSVFMARTPIDVYSVDHQALADRIAEFAKIDNDGVVEAKFKARDIAEKNYASDVVLKKWKQLIDRLGLQ